MNYTRQTDFTDLRETLNKIDGVEQTIMEREVSITTLNRWAKYAKDVADYMSNQLSAGDAVPTTMDSFLKKSGFSDEKKLEIKSDPYYFKNIRKVAQAVNKNDIASLGNTGPKTEHGTSFGGGDATTVLGRERQVRLDKSLKAIQSLAKEKENASKTKEFYAPKPPKDLDTFLRGKEADPIELTGAATDTVEPTWDGQTADEIRAELDKAYGGRENWQGKDFSDENTFDVEPADTKQATKPKKVVKDPAGQVISEPKDDKPLDTPLDWEMDDAEQQFKDLDKEYDAQQQAKAQADVKAKIDQENSRENWQKHFASMSDDEFAKVDHTELTRKYGDNAIDGYLDSKFDRRDNASIKAVDKEIANLNKAMDVKPKQEPAKAVNYGAMSDDEYDKAYDKEMQRIISKGYTPYAKDWDEAKFDKNMWDKLGKMDATRAQQQKDIQVDKEMDQEMDRIGDQFAKLDKEVADREAKALANKQRAQDFLQMRAAEKAQADMEKQWDKDNPEGFDKVKQDTSKAVGQIGKAGKSFANYLQSPEFEKTAKDTVDDAGDWIKKQWDKFIK